MRAAKHILSVILMVTILSSGLPFFSPEDANKDSIVNLEDAILHVRDFTHTADKPEAFTSGLGKALTTLHVLAGLKMTIKPVKENASKTQSGLNLTYLIPSVAVLAQPSNSSRVSQDAFIYESILFPPNPHPPRAG